MNKLLLSAAIGLATSMSPVWMPVAHAEISISASEQADQTEKRVKDFITQADKMYQQALQHPYIDSIKVSVDNYQRGENSATADSTITLVFNQKYLGKDAGDAFTLTLVNDISYTDAMLKDDQLAEIKSHILVDDALLSRLDIPKEDEPLFKELVGSLTMDTKLLKDDMVEQNIAIAPIDVEKDGTHITYEGLQADSRFNQNDIANMIYDAEGSFKSGMLKGNGQSEQYDYDYIDGELKETTKTVATEMTLQAFTGTYSSTASGSVEMETSPLALSLSEDGVNTMEATVEKFHLTGSDMVYDEALHNFTGKVNYTLDSLSLKTPEMPQAIEFKKIGVNAETAKNGDLYDIKGGLAIEPSTDIMSLAGIPGLMIDSLKGQFTLENVSAKAAEDFQTFGAVAGTGDDQEAEDMIKQLMGEIVASDAKVRTDLVLDTEAGTAKANAFVRLSPDSGVSPQQWQDALKSDSPDEFGRLLSDALLVNADVEVPVAIIDATGMTAMVEQMGAPYLKKENGNFIIKFVKDSNGMTVNDQALPDMGH